MTCNRFPREGGDALSSRNLITSLVKSIKLSELNYMQGLSLTPNPSKGSSSMASLKPSYA